MYCKYASICIYFFVNKYGIYNSVVKNSKSAYRYANWAML